MLKVTQVCVEAGVKLYPHVNASRLAINKIQMATPMCFWSNFSMVLSEAPLQIGSRLAVMRSPT